MTRRGDLSSSWGGAPKRTARKQVGTLLGCMLIAIGVAACGGGQKTTTIGAQEAQREIAQCSKMPSLTGNGSVPGCPADTGRVTINCGAGLTTSSSCVFAENTRRAYLAAQRRYGQPPTGLTVTTNPVSCTTSGSSWRCTSRKNPASWVQQG